MALGLLLDKELYRNFQSEAVVGQGIAGASYLGPTRALLGFVPHPNPATRRRPPSKLKPVTRQRGDADIGIGGVIWLMGQAAG